MKLILLIDDDQQIRLLFGLALRNEGYRVIEADSGASGLELARQQIPDLILTDINMPGGDGQALLSHIRHDPELCTRQVVLMTGRPDLVSPRNGMEQGADDFLVKPVTRAALLSCVEARLKRGDLHWRVEDRALQKWRSSMTSKLPHEFFTPLAGILGLAQIIDNDLATLNLPEIRELNQNIYQSAQRLHRTLRNYLLVLELSAELDPKPLPESTLSPVEVRNGLQTGVDLAVEGHGRKDDLTLDWEDASLRITPMDLSIMVEELLDNSFKFSRRGTPVTCRLRKDGVLTVTDAGRGMTPEEIERVGAFRQFDRKKYEQQGLGLGLFIVQKLAVIHGAQFSIHAQSEGVQVRVAFQTAQA